MAEKSGRRRSDAGDTTTKKRASSPAGHGHGRGRGGAAGAPELARLVAGPTLATARVDSVEGDHVRVVIGRQPVVAVRDDAVHPAVIRAAAHRGERVLVERGDDGVWIVVGALRTQPTPGIDVAEEYTIEAERVKLVAHDKVTLVAEATSVTLRGDDGEIESHAPRIVSRADGLHTITGRELKLN